MSTPPLLGPTRVRFGVDPVAAIGGAWYPYTVQLADELPGLLASARAQFGVVTGIDVTWQSFRRLPGLDSPDSPATPPMMTLSTPVATARLLVIPPRTASSLAAILLRLASNTVQPQASTYSLEFRRAERILELAARSVSFDTRRPAVQ